MRPRSTPGVASRRSTHGIPFSAMPSSYTSPHSGLTVRPNPTRIVGALAGACEVHLRTVCPSGLRPIGLLYFEVELGVLDRFLPILRLQFPRGLLQLREFG